MSQTDQPSTSDDTFYTPAQRSLQHEFDTRPLADQLEDAIVVDTLDDFAQHFIGSRDFFYLATVSGDGEPTVSYKGGPVGLVAILDDRTLAFPLYDGNGMFLSAGNVADSGKVGLLFMDFETPHRVRVQGTATLDSDPELLERFPGAMVACRVSVTNAFVNCARYIHKHTRTVTSPYVPDENGEQPLPSWKRIDGLQEVIGDRDRAQVADAGGTITEQEYGAKLLAGES